MSASDPNSSSASFWKGRAKSPGASAWRASNSSSSAMDSSSSSAIVSPSLENGGAMLHLSCFTQLSGVGTSSVTGARTRPFSAASSPALCSVAVAAVSFVSSAAFFLASSCSRLARFSSRSARLLAVCSEV